MVSMLAALSTACAASTTFSCDDPSQCVKQSEAGFCEPNGFCSFPDDSCASGRRYGKHAAAGIAETCVALPGSTEGLTDGVLDSSTTGAAQETSSSSRGPDDTTGSGTTASDTSLSSTGVASDPTTGDETTTGTTSTTSTLPQHLELPAAIAECTDPVQLDPAACAAADGPASLNVDNQDSDFAGEATRAWLRFEVPGQLQGLQVTSVRLRLVVTDHPDAQSNAGGEIWRTEAFELQSLTQLQPALIELVSVNVGPVVQGDVVEWPLPSTIVESSSVYLGVIAVSNDGVNYWNNDGAAPPVLLVDTE
jgi:hypothetical protein